MELSVVLTYRDTELEGQARSLCREILVEMGAHVDFVISEWKFSTLSIPSLCQIAVTEAAAAQVVVVAARATEDLPSEVKNWLEGWTRNATETMALVVLVGAPRWAAGAVWDGYGYLKSKAQQRGMRYFLRSFELPSDEGQSPPSMEAWTLRE